MATSIKVPIFADTNLGTHIAFDVNPTLKASDFKRELEEAHLNCFPKLGKIKINRLMTTHNENEFLKDPLLAHQLYFQFHDFGGTWLVHLEACLESEIMKSDSTLSVEPRNFVPNSNANSVNCKAENMATKRISGPKVVPSSIEAQKCHVSRNEGAKGELGGENKLGAISENHSEAISEAVSVSGIIKKYFCDYEYDTFHSEVTSRANQIKGKEKLKNDSEDNFSKEKLREKSQFTPTTPVRKIIFPSAKGSRGKISKNKFRKTEVGKRLLVASNEMGSNKSLLKSSRGLYCCKKKNSSPSTYSSLIKSLVFEIPDDDE